MRRHDSHSARTARGKHLVAIYPNSGTAQPTGLEPRVSYTTTPVDATCAECADMLKGPADIRETQARAALLTSLLAAKPAIVQTRGAVLIYGSPQMGGFSAPGDAPIFSQANSAVSTRQFRRASKTGVGVRPRRDRAGDHIPRVAALGDATRIV